MNDELTRNSAERPFIPVPIPRFDSRFGISLRQVESGGWIVTAAARHPSVEPAVIASYSTTDDLLAGLQVTAWGGRFDQGEPA